MERLSSRERPGTRKVSAVSAVSAAQALAKKARKQASEHPTDTPLKIQYMNMCEEQLTRLQKCSHEVPRRSIGSWMVLIVN